MQGDPAPFNMIERKEPDFVKFGDGEEIIGVLFKIERLSINDQIVHRYVVQDLDDSQKLYSFLGTYMIDTKLRCPEDLGHVIVVRCVGTDPAVTRNGNAMKRFFVSVSDRPYSQNPSVKPLILPKRHQFPFVVAPDERVIPLIGNVTRQAMFF